MSNCVAPGFGTGRWGLDPWGGALAPDVGGPLPTVPPFDIYCVGPCGPISSLLTHPEVMTIGDGSQFPVDGITMNQEMNSGGTYSTTDAAIVVNVSVPSDFTLEFTYISSSLPPSFSSLVTNHFYVGTFNPAAGCAGLFFSQVGISYTGAVHIDGSGNLVLDTPVQDLPNSQVLVAENTYWTCRIVMSYSTGAVYIYVTETSELNTIGHQLRYVMPAISSSSAARVPPSETLLSVRGTLTAPTYIELNELCLGTGAIIPFLPPVASAGTDQALRFCSILQLDGSASFDPQGANLLYAWRLIGAPDGSQYIYYETDGVTYPLSPPTGFTDRLYSPSLAVINETTPILSGSVIVLAGTPYNIVTTGTDGDGFFVRVDGYVLPDNLVSNTAFTYVLQNGLYTATSVKPTFYPDVPGIFQFDLTVYNGSLFSVPSEVIANVVESVVARGCTPDLTFIWNYLSDFWNLISDPDRISVFWQGLAQVAAAQLLTLWQVDYNKSLRDIQRTFQRRWLSYSMLMQENPNLLAVTTIRDVVGGLLSVPIPSTGVGGVGGTHLDLQLASLSVPTVIQFMSSGKYSAAQLQGLIQAALAQVDPNITVNALVSRNGAETILSINAPYIITVLGTSTFPLYTQGAMNGPPSGVAGSAVATLYTYRTETSLQFLGLKPNDFLCVDGVAYRIASIVDDPSDPYYYQRVSLLDELPTTVGSDWTIAGTATSPDLDFYDGLCEQSDRCIFQVVNNATQAVMFIESEVLGSNATLLSNLPVDATPVGQYLVSSAYSVYLYGVLRRKYIPADPLLVDVPLLQEFIVNTDDTQVLRRNVDYFLDTFRGAPCIRFITPVPSIVGGPDVWQGQDPPDVLWAETSYIDNRPVIEGNFGIPANFTLADLAQLPSNVDYLSAVQGLWYAYWNGPTVFDLRVGAQILLGLPFAEQTGVIQSIRTDFSPTTGQILVQDTADTTIVREYTYPVSLPLEVNPATGVAYAVGDTVQQFAPLVEGVEISDYVNDPTWFAGYLSQGVFLEVQKFFEFLVRVDSPAFNLPALLFARSFVLRIKPTYTYPLFVVLQQLGNTGDTTEDVSDLVQYNGELFLFAGACFSGSDGVATMFDQPNPAGGGWRSQFDRSEDLSAPPPTFPTPTYPIVWGFDKNYLCPEDFILGTLCTTFVTPLIPPFDSIFSFDEPVYTADMVSFSAGLTVFVPGAGLQIEGPVVIPTAGTLNTLTLIIALNNPTEPSTFNLILKQNGTPVVTEPFDILSGGVTLTVPISVPVAIGDVLTVFIQPTGLSDVDVAWDSVLVESGVSVSWAFDTTLPAGTYCSFRTL